MKGIITVYKCIYYRKYLFYAKYDVYTFCFYCLVIMIFSLVWKPMKSIAIIWAWAAGLMVAATILENQSEEYLIRIFEKNTSPWKKVIISGGWRCNVTTSIDDRKILATKYTRGWEFIRKAISNNKNTAIVAFGSPYQLKQFPEAKSCRSRWKSESKSFEHFTW